MIVAFEVDPPESEILLEFLIEVLEGWGRTWICKLLILVGDDGWIKVAIEQGVLTTMADGSYIKKRCPGVCSAAFIWKVDSKIVIYLRLRFFLILLSHRNPLSSRSFLGVMNKHVLNWTRKSINKRRKGHIFLLAQHDKNCLSMYKSNVCCSCIQLERKNDRFKK